MVRNPKIVQYVEELDLLIIADGGKVYHINGDVIAGMWKAYMEGYGIDYDICEGCECVDPETAEPIKRGRWIWDKENDKMYCSECGYETDNWGVHQESDPIEWQLPNYCENCGARMDGGENG